jgi:hypothetical protein
MQESTRSILGKYNPTDDIWKKKTWRSLQEQMHRICNQRMVLFFIRRTGSHILMIHGI